MASSGTMKYCGRRARRSPGRPFSCCMAAPEQPRECVATPASTGSPRKPASSPSTPTGSSAAGTTADHRLHQAAPPRDDQFLLDLADHLSAIGLVDRRRVYIAGISNGGIMALQMACSHAERIAGIAVIAASLPVGFQ